jgi:PPM family protein phosphatase
VPDDDLAKLISVHKPLEERARALVSLANDRGGRDNITAVLVDYRAV